MESLPQDHRLSEEGGVKATVPMECRDLFRGEGLAEAANDVRMSQLARTIELEIIPRLMLAHRSTPEPVDPVPTDGTSLGHADVEHFAKIVLSTDEDAAFASILSYRARGVPVEALYLGLLAPTARYLGELWNEDLCSLCDVTVGLGRLQRVLRELSPAFGCSVEHPAQGRRVLLVPSPGEQHTFGLVMVGEFFRRAGWDVSGGAWIPGRDAAALVAAEWFDVIGFSLGAEVHLQELADCIRAVRHATCNHNIAVMVGGPLFGAHPECVAMVGADGMTIDGQEAPLLAERLIVGTSAQHLRGCSGSTP